MKEEREKQVREDTERLQTEGKHTTETRKIIPKKGLISMVKLQRLELQKEQVNKAISKIKFNCAVQQFSYF